jgi:prepilin-type N-terminal cleavage/methylation domain-containing protein
MNKAFTLSEILITIGIIGVVAVITIPTLITKMKTKAFTLAEVLIVIGVIGVISAITMPNLMQKYTEFVTVRKVKEAYAILSQAYSRAIEEHNGNFADYRNWGCTTSRSSCVLITLGKYMNVVDSHTGNAEYQTKQIYSLKGELSGTYSLYSITLTNGLVFSVNAGTFNTTNNFKTTYQNWNNIAEVEKTRYNLYVDVNGDEPPNAFGKDIFPFKLHEKTVAGAGNRTEPYYYFSRMCNLRNASTWDGGINGYDCTGWVLEKGNMDYLHCNDLSWNKKSQCK